MPAVFYSNAVGETKKQYLFTAMMVPPSGFEPEAFPLGGERSIQLSYRGLLSLGVYTIGAYAIGACAIEAYCKAMHYRRFTAEG